MAEHGPVLLIVEDDLSTRYILSRILGQRGWQVRAVPTLAEGLALLETKPDCVVVDLQLSDGVGESLVHRIREAGLASRVVVCTAVREAVRLRGLDALRPDAVLHKPIEMSELLEACSA